MMLSRFEKNRRFVNKLSYSNELEKRHRSGWTRSANFLVQERLLDSRIALVKPELEKLSVNHVRLYALHIKADP